MRGMFRARGAKPPVHAACWEVPLPAATPPKADHRPWRTGRVSGRTMVLAGIVGAAMTAGIAMAASNWTVGLTAGSSASAQAASVTNLAITQVTGTALAPTNQLYPGGTGDVLLKITNPNPFPVTVTAITTPSTQATGYTDNGLTTPVAGSACNGTNSTVTWVGAAGSHPLTTALVVAANGSLTVTLTNEATMGSSAPAACEAAYFSMASLTGITATGGASAATSSPATDTYS